MTMHPMHVELLASLRSTQEVHMPEACQVVRTVEASDGRGGHTHTSELAYTGACRIAIAGTPQERLVAQQLQIAIPYTVILEYGADVAEGDTINISGGRVLQVRGVLEPSFRATTRAICEEHQ